MSSNLAIEQYPFDEWEDEWDGVEPWAMDDGWLVEMPGQGVHGIPTPLPIFLAIAAMLLLAWFALNLKHGPLPPEPVQPVTPSADGRFAFPDAARVVAPYAVDYTITQGVHGQSYGHMAVDLAVGRGTAVTSPINGRVTALYTDEYGNPTLVIENQRYTVTLLHGDYTVSLNDEVTIGQTVGTESNNGYTMDMVGNLCYGAAYCGNHTHFNLYDKELGANVNPLQVMEP